MQADAGESRQGEGEDTGRHQHTKIARPNTSQPCTPKLYYCCSPGSPGTSLRPGECPGAHAALPVPAAVSEGLPHQYHSSETSPHHQRRAPRRLRKARQSGRSARAPRAQLAAWHLRAATPTACTSIGAAPSLWNGHRVLQELLGSKARVRHCLCHPWEGRATE